MAYDWNPIDQAVDRAILAEKLTPLCRVTGAAVRRKFDERRGYGIDLPLSIYTGRELAQFTVTFLLVTVADWTYYQTEFRDLLHGVPKRGPVRAGSEGYAPGKCLSIWHPQLAPLGITQCVVLEEPQEDLDEFMLGTVVVKFQQINPAPKAAYAKPEAPRQSPPLTASQREIQRLTDELASQRQQNELAGA